MVELRGVFLNSFNIINDAMGVFVKGLHKHAGSVLDDLADIKKAMKDVGLGGSSVKDIIDLGSARRSGGRSGQEFKATVNVNLDNELLKQFVKRTSVESISSET